MIKLDEDLRKAIDTVADITRQKIMGTDKNNEKLFEKVQAYGIGIFAIDSDECDGFSLWNEENNQPQIYLDVPSQSESRRRFTLAHELGHIVIDQKWNLFTKDRPESVDSDGVISVLFRDKDKEMDTRVLAERRANEFAGAFLMPESSVKELVGADDSIEEKISSVSKFFGVTLKAAENRLHVLGLL
mgnify:CR=1 FL=1